MDDLKFLPLSVYHCALIFFYNEHALPIRWKNVSGNSRLYYQLGHWFLITCREVIHLLVMRTILSLHCLT